MMKILHPTVKILHAATNTGAAKKKKKKKLEGSPCWSSG